MCATGGIGCGKVPEALNIPPGQFRPRLEELPRDREIHVICRSGQRAYYATRILCRMDSKRKTSRAGCFRLHIII